MKHRIFLPLLLLLTALPLSAQFTTGGADPCRIRWRQMGTGHYRIIYPTGLDSLARVYGDELERWRIPVGRSAGFLPNQQYRRPMPVILHAYNATSNGSVTWAPRRMEFYTTPMSWQTEALPWVRNLAIHESRHVAQMQLGAAGIFRPLNGLLGQMVPGALAGVYPGPHLLEGDAVVTETALSQAGRGRDADFLEYWKTALGSGERRSWYDWLGGSLTRYTPNHYGLGYLTIAGVRTQFDDPLFTARYFNNVLRRPLRIHNFSRTIRQASGQPLKPTWERLQEEYARRWSEEAAARAPYTPLSALTRPERDYVSHQGILVLPGREPGDSTRVWAIRSGLSRPAALVSIEADGKEKTLVPLASNVTHFSPDTVSRRIYWSELVPHARWEEKQVSSIYYKEYDGDLSKTFTLVKGGRYVNPAPSEDGEKIAAVEFPLEGGSMLVVFSHQGELISRTAAPDSLQLAEPVFLDGQIYVAGLSDKGMGLYKAPEQADGTWSCLLAPQPVKITDLKRSADGLLFTCDRSGVNEIYRFLPGSNRFIQLTSTLNGVSGGVFSPDGTSLYVSEPRPDTRRVSRIAAEALRTETVDYADIFRDPMAEKLSAQEKVLEAEGTLPDRKDRSRTKVFAPKPFRKLPHIPHFHSWAPFFYDYDDLSGFSMDIVEEEAEFGASGLFQNLLGTASGMVGYRAAQVNGKWHHGGHLKLTYSGWFPVFDMDFDINARAARQYRFDFTADPIQSSVREMDSPYMFFRGRTYLPLGSSRNGISFGFVPQFSFQASNDFIWVKQPIQIDNGTFPSMNWSARAYLIRNRASSQIFPKSGIGVEFGRKKYFALGDFLFSPESFLYLYGYLPGLTPRQGFKFTLTGQWMDGTFSPSSHNVVNTLPRGIGEDLGTFLGYYANSQMLFTVDYAIPFGNPRASLGPITYIRNFVLQPFVDIASYNLHPSILSTPLVVGSVGADFLLHLSYFCWMPAPFEFGVRACSNFWNTLPVKDQRLHVHFIFRQTF